jgi:hypothetical protein
MTTPTDPQVFVKRLLDLYGGHNKAFEMLDRRFRAVAERWDQDAGTIGRILRAHLFVEHYLTQYLQVTNPNLPDVGDARLSFAQKVALLGTTDRSVAHLTGGLQRLNKVRNRLAHTLRAEVTVEDSQALLSIDLFREMRRAGVAPQSPSDDPVTVLEDFAKHAGTMLESASSPESKLWADALSEDANVPTNKAT